MTAEVRGPVPGGHDPPGAVHERSSVALFYYRPLRNLHHGETQYVRRMLRDLEPLGPPEVVAPEGGSRTTEPNAYLTMLRNLLATNLVQLRYLLRTSRRTSPRVLVVVDAYSALLPLLWSVLRQVPMVYVASDPPEEYARTLRSSGIRGGHLLRFFRTPIERAMFARAKLILTRSSWMSRVLAGSGCDREKLRVLPHRPQVVAPEAGAVARFQSHAGLAHRIGIVFLGDFEYPPNRESARFVLDCVLPTLRTVTPQARVILVGPGSERFDDPRDPSLLALGAVPDLSPVLLTAVIGISPSIVSGGTSAKTIDYLAHGLVCLVTPVVAESLSPNPALHVASREKFAGALIALVRGTAPPVITEEYLRARLASATASDSDDTSPRDLLREVVNLASPVAS